MNQISQYEKINSFLAKECDVVKSRIMSISAMIHKKNDHIRQLISYEQEYEQNKSLVFSKSMPLFNQNMTSFIAKLHVVIMQENDAIIGLKRNRDGWMKKYQQLSAKTALIEKIINKIKRHQQIKLDVIEQGMLDEMTINISQRREHV
jgi:flagellar biosynthesis chaperone FliJ